MKRVVTIHWRPPQPASGDRRFLLIEDDLRRAFDVQRLVVTDKAVAAGSSVDTTAIDLVVPGVRKHSRIRVGQSARSYDADPEALLSLIEQQQPDAVWIEHWHLAVAVDVWRQLRQAGVRLVFDWDLRSRYYLTGARWFARRSPVRAAAMLVQGLSLRRFEKRYLPAFDLLSVPSAVEQRMLARFLPETRVTTVPVREPTPRGSIAEPQDFCATRIGFLGSGYAPNVDGLHDFLGRVWPRIRERLPQLRLAIAGDVGSGIAGAPGNVDILGRVDDPDGFIRSCAVFVSPVGYGSGTQNKIAQALAAGVPVVSDLFGADAFGSHPLLLPARSPEEWSTAIHEQLSRPRTIHIPEPDRRAVTAASALAELLRSS